MLNEKLENRILGIARKFCGSNCKHCKTSLVQNLQNRSKLFTSNKKRNLGSNKCLDLFYDALEFSLDSLPRKYRKQTPTQHRTSPVLKDSNDSAKPKQPVDTHTSSKKRSLLEISSYEADSILESIKRRIKLENDYPYQKLDDNEEEKEKKLEEQYNDFVKKIDLATVTEFIRADSKLESQSKSPSHSDKGTSEDKTGSSKSPFTVRSPTFGSQPNLVEKAGSDSDANKEFKSQESSTAQSNKEESDKSNLESSGLFDNKTDLFKGQSDSKPLDLFQSGSGNEQKPNLFEDSSSSKNLFSTETNKDKSPFDIFDKINAPIPQGNPLFAPTQNDSVAFKPKTDGANFVFGQSSALPEQSQSTSTNIFGNTQTPQLTQNQPATPQFVIPGFGQTVVQQPATSNPFGGQFFRSKRGRGRGRLR